MREASVASGGVSCGCVSAGSTFSVPEIVSVSVGSAGFVCKLGGVFKISSGFAPRSMSFCLTISCMFGSVCCALSWS